MVAVISRRPHLADDDGQVLILAVVFVSSIILVVGATLGFASTAMHGYNTMHTSQLGRYAADGAVEKLIVAEQANNANAACLATLMSVSNGATTAYATCQFLDTPLPLERTVLFCAYLTQPTPGTCPSAATGLLLRSEVVFQDLPTPSGVSYGGEQIVSWSYGQN